MLGNLQFARLIIHKVTNAEKPFPPLPKMSHIFIQNVLYLYQRQALSPAKI